MNFLKDVTELMIPLYGKNRVLEFSTALNCCCREISCLITFSGGFICSYGLNNVYIVEQIPGPGEDIVFKGTKKIVFPKRVIKREGYQGKYLLFYQFYYLSDNLYQVVTVSNLCVSVQTKIC